MEMTGWINLRPLLSCLSPQRYWSKACTAGECLIMFFSKMFIRIILPPIESLRVSNLRPRHEAPPTTFAHGPRGTLQVGSHASLRPLIDGPFPLAHPLWRSGWVEGIAKCQMPS